MLTYWLLTVAYHSFSNRLRFHNMASTSLAPMGGFHLLLQGDTTVFLQFFFFYFIKNLQLELRIHILKVIHLELSLSFSIEWKDSICMRTCCDRSSARREAESYHWLMQNIQKNFGCSNPSDGWQWHFLGVPKIRIRIFLHFHEEYFIFSQFQATKMGGGANVIVFLPHKSEGHAPFPTCN